MPAVDILSRYLGAHGHSVAGAGSAEEALAALRAGSFDMVLLDVVLPGRTGLQALAEMRTATSAPIHMMSGQNDDDTRQDARLLGASGFFGKPLDLAAILAAIAELLPPPA